MKTIRYTGLDSYHSTDPWNGDKPINLAAGDDVEVSDEKAAQLLADFPHLFAGAKALPEKPQGTPPPRTTKPAAKKKS